MSLLNAVAPYRRDERSTLRVPVVMPLVEVRVDEEGNLSVLLDREPYSADAAMRRDDLEPMLNDIATDLGTPVRVEVHEADDSTFTDIITPPRQPIGETPSTPQALASICGISGAGFVAGEQVEICVVVARRVAAHDGTAQLRLPPALLARHPGVVLVGRTSGAAAVSEGTT